MDHTSQFPLISRHHRNHWPVVPVSGRRIGIHPSLALSPAHHLVQLLGNCPLFVLLTPPYMVQCRRSIIPDLSMLVQDFLNAIPHKWKHLDRFTQFS